MTNIVTAPFLLADWAWPRHENRMVQQPETDAAALIRAHMDDKGFVSVKVTPGASSDGIATGVDVQGRALLHVRIRGKAIDGAANAALIAYVAAELGCPKGRISVERGATSRLKRLRISV